jgi:hypothetical protein
MLPTSPFPLSNKVPNEITVLHSNFNGVKKYIVCVPKGMMCHESYMWCYEHLPANTWIQYREYIDKLDVNGYNSITWDQMTFEFEHSAIAVEFALRFN